MLLNIKQQIFAIQNDLTLIVLASLILLLNFFFYTDKIYFNFNFLEFNYSIIESLTNDFFLSQILYNYFMQCFLISGIILLVGIIGAIVLTLEKKAQNEISYRQHTRAINTNSFICREFSTKKLVNRW